MWSSVSMQWESNAKSRVVHFIFSPRSITDSRWKDDQHFVIDLLNRTGVLTVHGSGFGSIYGSGHFRIVYLPPEEILEKAMDKLEHFLNTK